MTVSFVSHKASSSGLWHCLLIGVVGTISVDKNSYFLCRGFALHRATDHLRGLRSGDHGKRLDNHYVTLC